MGKWSALFAVIIAAVVAVYVFQPSYRVRSFCRYMRTEEECACYSHCVYKSVSGEQMYFPPMDAPYCPAVDVFPRYSYTPETRSKQDMDKSTHYGDDPAVKASKDPCINPAAALGPQDP